MDFYDEKSRSLPRFVYRNLAGLLQQNPAAARQRLIADFCGYLQHLKPQGDWLKLKWCTPPILRNALTPEEMQPLEKVLGERRSRRNQRYLEVYPHCSDEYSLDVDFLDAVFGAERHQLVSKQTRIFTMGSCFARNIAEYLHRFGYTVQVFGQAEDLNSPFSNAKLLEICAASEADRTTYLKYWIRKLYAWESQAGCDELFLQHTKSVERVTGMVRNAEWIIVTCGNVLDYFHDTSGADVPKIGNSPVAPKFLTLGDREDVNLTQQFTNSLREAGAAFRMGTYAQTLEALDSQLSALRKLNSGAQVLFTLSPVPIDSALGLHSKVAAGAIEIDCISKSTLRAALAEFVGQSGDAGRIFYFPSFEIVRWIANCMNAPAFGAQDAASRHVSQEILEGIYRYFIHKFCCDTVAAHR